MSSCPLRFGYLVSNLLRVRTDIAADRIGPRTSDYDRIGPRTSDYDGSIRRRNLPGRAIRDCSIAFRDIFGASVPGARIPHAVRDASVVPVGCRTHGPL